MMNDNSSILYDLKNSDQLIVTFGGISQGMGMPIFEFMGVLGHLNCDKIYIRDFNQAWYHKGLKNHSENINQILSDLKTFVEGNNYKKVSFIGNSMGGYAAILFGSLLNIDVVVAFSPQTFIDFYKRLWVGDKRWKYQVNAVYSYTYSEKKYYDLKNTLKKNPSRCNIKIYYSLNDNLDTLHAIRLRDVSNVHLYPLSYGHHDMVKKLRDEGMISEILSECV